MYTAQQERRADMYAHIHQTKRHDMDSATIIVYIINAYTMHTYTQTIGNNQ